MKYRLLAAVLAVVLAFGQAFLAAQPEDPHGPYLALSWDRYSASGVCIKSDGHQSLVVSNNHLFSIQPFEGAPYPLGNYPLKGKVSTIGGTASWEGIAVAGDADADLSFVVVNVALLSSPLAKKNAPVGAEVWHRGMGAKGAYSFGKVLPSPANVRLDCTFISDLRSIPGDSGSGVFSSATGEVVAVNCGRTDLPINAPERGTSAESIRAVLERVKAAIPEKLRP